MGKTQVPGCRPRSNVSIFCSRERRAHARDMRAGHKTLKKRYFSTNPKGRAFLYFNLAPRKTALTVLAKGYALESNHKVFAGYSSYARFPLAGSRTFRRKSQKTDSYFQPHTVCKFSKTENGSMVRTRGSVSFALKIVGISTNDFAGEISPTRAALLAAGPFADNVGILIPISNQR